MQTVVAVVLRMTEVEGATRVVHEAQDLADFRRGHSLAVEHVVLEATAISRWKKVHHAAPMATCETPRQHVFDVTSVGRRSSPWTCNSVGCGHRLFLFSPNRARPKAEWGVWRERLRVARTRLPARPSVSLIWREKEETVPQSSKSVKVEIKFHLECKLHFPSAQLMLRQMHCTNVSESIEAKY